MKVSSILEPVIAAQIEGKVLEAFQEVQKETISDKPPIKNENNAEQKVQHKIDMLV